MSFNQQSFFTRKRARRSAWRKLQASPDARRRYVQQLTANSTSNRKAPPITLPKLKFLET